mgnify:CR=1 FL=1
MKKLIAFLLAVMLLVCLLPTISTPASAALIAQGVQEITTYSFISSKAIDTLLLADRLQLRLQSNKFG